jgi:shikimate kinase
MARTTGNIILVGFMGVGKGRTARQLAADSDRFTVDTDDLIETLVKKKIRTIFSEQGEPAFRLLEQRTARWLEENVCNTIVSTGGGFFMVPNLRQLGTVIYLHSSLEAIIAVMQQHPKAEKKFKKRPLLKDLDSAARLFEQRLPLYRRVADIEVNVEGMSTPAICADILGTLS